MQNEHKLREQLANEVMELRQQVAELVAADTERARAGEAISGRRIWLPVAVMFVLLCILVWLNETVDLPHLMLGMPHTPINWREAILEIVLIASVGLFVVLRLIRDITERERVEEALREKEELHQSLMGNIYFGFTLVDVNYRILMVNTAVGRNFHKPVGEFVGRECFREFEKRQSVCPYCPGTQAMATGQPAEAEIEGVRDDGSRSSARVQAFPTIGPDGEVTGFIEIVEDITERKRAERALERRAAQLATVGEIGRQIASILDPDELLRQIVHLLEDTFSYRYVYIFLLDEGSRGLMLREGAGAAGRAHEGARIAIEARSINACVARTGKPLLANDVAKEHMYLLMEEVAETKSELAVPIKVKDKVIGTLDVQSTGLNAFDESDLFTLQALASQAGIAIENARLYEEAQQRIGELKGLHEISQAFSSMTDARETYGELTRRMAKLIGCQACTIATYDHQTRKMRAQPPGYGAPDELIQSLHYKVDGPARDAWNFRLQGPLLANDIVQIPDFFSQWVEGFDLFNLLIVPMTYEGRITGLVYAANKPSGFAGNDSKLLTIFASQAAVIIEDARLYEETRRRAEEMTSVYNIGVATTSTLSLDEVLKSVCEQVSRLMNVSSFYIALCNEEKGELRFELALDEGVPVEKFTKKIANGGGLSGWVVQSRRPLLLKDMEKEKLPIEAIVVGLPSRSWLGVPLLYRDQVVGVMGVQSYRPNAFGEDDQQSLSTIAAQVAIAIENARLYEELQQSFIQTIAALAAAVDAKDPYTGGHSQHTTELAAAIAQELGLDDEEIELIRYASLLHDVGKIGVSERILLKPGPLNAEEWEVVRRHPALGASIVEKAASLYELVPIILHHHERYDGQGYPDGLRGEDIPLKARILSVADAYEAMTSDRAYRPAMTVEQALATLREGADRQWDGEVVDACLKLFTEKGFEFE